MTEDFAQRLCKKSPAGHDNDAGGVASTVTREITHPALIERGVMRVLPTPPGVMPIKSRYLYRMKYNKDGCIKKYMLD